MSLRAFPSFCVLAVLALGASSSSCGYHVGGKADLLPKSIQTISVPAFQNPTTRYRLTDILPQNISREFLTRTRYRIEPNPSLADAVLNGSINTVTAYPTVFDAANGRATSIQVSVSLSVKLIERTTGRVLFARNNLEFRQTYEIAIDPHQFFDESDSSYDRVGRDVARSVVSAVVENF